MSICPGCGLSLDADQIVARDGWIIDPRGAATFGRHGFTRNAWVQILHTLASEAGRPVNATTLLNRVSGSERENTLAAQITLLRRDLKRAGIPDPIQTITGQGYRWHAREDMAS